MTLNTMKKTTFLFPLLLVLYEISTYLSNDMYLPALPEMMQYFSISQHQAQLTLTWWFGGLAATPLLFGAISDRYGRRMILLSGGVVFIFATWLCSLTTSFGALLAYRFLQGSVISSMMVGGYATIHEYYDHREAIRILAIMASITVLAPAFGPLLGAFILYQGTWRTIFEVIAGWAFVTIFFLYFKMPETHPPEKRVPIHFVSLFKSYGRVLSNANYMLQLFILAFLFAGFIVWITVSPFLVIEHFHYSVIAFGWFQAFIFIFYIIGNQSVDYLIDWIGIHQLIRLGMMLAFISGVLVSMAALLFPDTLYPYIGAMTIYSLGTSFCFAPLNRLIIESSDEPMGIRVAMFTVLIMLSLAITTAIAGFIYSGAIFSLSIITTVCALSACSMWMIKNILKGISKN